MVSVEKDNDILKSLRKKIFITGFRGGMAHLASCFSSLEILYTLYLKGVLNYNSENPKDENRDRFILSKGHAGLALFAILNQANLLSDNEFNSYLKPNSCIGGEPCMRDCEWVEATTGSLGHGLPVGLGMAMALKGDNKNSKVYVLLGDGECQEGTNWEAIMFAPKFELDNLVAILDCNKIQKMDFTNKIIGDERWMEKWASFGWDILEVDGHNIEELNRILLKPMKKNTPRLIIANTIKGKGVSIMENNPNWHFKLPRKKELKTFMSELGISESEMEQ